MIEITRHEINNVLQGFTFYAPTSVVLLVHDGTLWYSKTNYRGHCSVGSPNQNAQAVAFESIEAANQFITDNGLVKFGDHYADWHETTLKRVIQTKTGNIRMLMDIPELAQYPAANNVTVIEEGNYVYMYANYILPEHETLFSNERYEAIIQNN